jgi:hypothetical protein
VVAEVGSHPGDLYPRAGFIVTNMTRPAERVVAFYNHRGTTEQHIKKGKNAVTCTRLSCHRFAANAARLQRHSLPYKLAKIDAKLVRHGRSITFTMAEVMVSCGLFQQILDATAMLRQWPRARCWAGRIYARTGRTS